MVDSDSPSAFLERCGGHVYRGLRKVLLAPAWALNGLFAALVLVNVALIVLVSGGLAEVEVMERQAEAADQRQQSLILVLLAGNLVMLPVAGSVAWSYRRRTRDQGRLQSVLSEIPDLVFFKDDQLQYLGANDAFLRFVDRPAEQVVGSTDSELFHAGTAEVCGEMDRRLFAEGQPPRCVEWVQYPDGQWVYLDTQESPLDLGDGRVGVVGIGRDLTATKRAQEVQERLALIVEKAPDPVGFAEPGEPPQGSYLNPAGRALLGLDADEAIGDVLRFYPEEVVRHQREVVLPQIWERGHWHGETVVRAVDGTEIPVEQTVMAHRDDSGTIQVLSTIVRDLRPYKQAQEALRQAALREETITNHLVDNLPGIFLLFGNADGRIQRWNRTLEAHTGLDGEALQACAPAELVPEADREAFRSAMAAVPATGQQTLEAGLLDGAGTAVPFQYHANWVGWDDEDYVCLLGFDIRERVRLEEERQALLETFENLAITDPLTGVANRRRLDEITAEEVDRARRYGHSLALLVIDVDLFKLVNDNHGHEVGDHILKHLVAVLREGLRSPDHLGRYGGEEFVVVAPETDTEGAERLAERLRAAVAAAEFPHDLPQTVSIGVAAQRDPNADALFRAADEAVYAAKETGRNRVVTAEA